MHQANTIPNSREVFLDLLFCSSDNIATTSASEDILGNSVHHTAIEFHIERSVDRPPDLKHKYVRYDFLNGNYEGLNYHLSSIDWDGLFCLDVNTCTDLFYGIMEEALDMFIPRKMFKTSNYPKWFSTELKQLIIAKKLAH